MLGVGFRILTYSLGVLVVPPNLRRFFPQLQRWLNRHQQDAEAQSESSSSSSSSSSSISGSPLFDCKRFRQLPAIRQETGLNE